MCMGIVVGYDLVYVLFQNFSSCVIKKLFVSFVEGQDLVMIVDNDDVVGSCVEDIGQVCFGYICGLFVCVN